MLKKCKWCGKKQEMRGKREFCPGRKCKNAWVYANRIDKTEKKESVKNQKDIPDDTSKFPTVIGQLTKVTTTADQCVRISIDIPVENIEVDVIQFYNQKVVVAFIGGNEKEDKKTNTKPEAKDKFFND
jgi:hypothetical protein